MREILTTIRGNATKDPFESRSGADPYSVQLRVAVNSSYYAPEKGEYEERKTEYVTVFARRSMARHLMESVRKGDPIIVTGRLSTSEWTADDGTVLHSLTIQAEGIGHDLTFGTSRFHKPSKYDAPDVDHRSGEILDAAGGDVPGGLVAPGTAGEAADHALVSG